MAGAGEVEAGNGDGMGEGSAKLGMCDTRQHPRQHRNVWAWGPYFEWVQQRAATLQGGCQIGQAMFGSDCPAGRPACDSSIDL